MDYFIFNKQKPIQKKYTKLAKYTYIIYPLYALKKIIQVSCKLRFPSFSLDENHLQFLLFEILSLEVSPVTSSETHVI